MASKSYPKFARIQSNLGLPATTFTYIPPGNTTDPEELMAAHDAKIVRDAAFEMASAMNDVDRVPSKLPWSSPLELAMADNADLWEIERRRCCPRLYRQAHADARANLGPGLPSVNPYNVLFEGMEFLRWEAVKEARNRLTRPLLAYLNMGTFDPGFFILMRPQPAVANEWSAVLCHALGSPANVIGMLRRYQGTGATPRKAIIDLLKLLWKG